MRGYNIGAKIGHKRRIIVFVLILALLGTAWWVKGYYSAEVSQPEQTNQAQAPEAVKIEPRMISGKYLFTGTIVLARAVESQARGDYAQPFSKLSSFDHDQYNAWFTDLECPVTDQKVSYQSQVDNLVFNCHTDWLPQFSKYFQFANLAGNHTYDMGADGFDQSVVNLQKAGVQAIGNYTPRETDDICEVVSLPVTVIYSDNSQKPANLPIAVCSVHYFAFAPGPGELETIAKYKTKMPVIALMHVGVEYLSTASGRQIEVGRALIDNGADFVVGNSPHWVQNTEVYKGKLIVYSTGNFIFDQLDEETNRGLNLDVEMTVEYQPSMQAWLELAESCKPRDDDCLQQITDNQLTTYQPQYKFDVIGSKNGYRVVTELADKALQSRIEKRANWAESLKLLNQ